MVRPSPSPSPDSASAAGNAALSLLLAKPRLRGWIHAGTFPIALIAGVVLIALSPPTAPRVATTIFMITTVLLFGTSAIYHLGTWTPKTTAMLRRADHANIFLIIAGSYTALAVLLLEKPIAKVLLIIVWSGALLGLAARMIWLGAPRWVYTPIYLGLSWVAVGYMGQFWKGGGSLIVWLICIGGFAYTLGAIIYAMKRPNLVPGWFGFHELFHVGTVIGWGTHYVAILIAVLRLT